MKNKISYRIPIVIWGLMALFSIIIGIRENSVVTIPIDDSVITNSTDDSISTQPGKSPDETSFSFRKVNINTADKETLMTLSGIGESKAKAILSYREQNGPFQKEEDLLLVSGIGPAIFEKIKEDITLRDE